MHPPEADPLTQNRASEADRHLRGMPRLRVHADLPGAAASRQARECNVVDAERPRLGADVSRARETRHLSPQATVRARATRPTLPPEMRDGTRRDRER